MQLDPGPRAAAIRDELRAWPAAVPADRDEPVGGATW
jgi:hypothetical protein